MSAMICIIPHLHIDTISLLDSYVHESGVGDINQPNMFWQFQFSCHNKPSTHCQKMFLKHSVLLVLKLDDGFGVSSGLNSCLILS